MGRMTVVPDAALLLGLLNSTVVTARGSMDLLGDGVAADWVREYGGLGSPGESRSLRQVRNVLRAVVRGAVSAVALESVLRQVRLRPVLDDNGLTWQSDVVDADHRLATRALLAWSAVEQRLPGRLRACANPDCELFLLDRSDPNTARWCSMRRCGNRLKVRNHYQRNRQPATGTVPDSAEK